tara:strand:+ start:5815 stop:6744 length:930 start_codon:yes stop_codon:yes gene_type:complete
MNTDSEKKICIVMAVHNGEKFLQEQLNSLEGQQCPYEIDLYISLDNTTDKSYEIIKKFNFVKVNLKKIYRCNFKSSAQNFIYLLSIVPKKYDTYMFSDQDDIWYENKILISQEKLNQMSNTLPSLVCSRTRIINSVGKSIGKSPLFKKQPSFKNALVQSIAGGNTMAFNHVSKELITKFNLTKDLPSHDWFIYLLVTSFDGEVIYLESPLVKYRKHKQNVIGPNQSLGERYTRMIDFLQGKFSRMFWINIENLEKYDLTNEKKEVLDILRGLKSKNFINRVRSVLKLNIYRQNIIASSFINLAIILKKV